MERTRIGIVGCGNISGAYLNAGTRFDNLEVVACADLLPERAQQKAEEFNVPKALTVEQIMADPDVEIIINLTIPKAHYEVAKAALTAGKHVHNEKPITVTREQGKELLTLAAERNLRVGSAPDTFMGGGLQTCRKVIDEGWIGRPVAATAFMLGHGPEGWHPDPEFFYKTGAGPMFDMGPYYLTALVNLLGPVRRVTGSAQISFPERLITSKPKYGTKIKVEVPTHIVGVMDFASGAVGTIITSFDVWACNLPRIEIYGTEGTLSVPDPNTFKGPVKIRRAGDSEWREMPLSHGYTDNWRSVAVADMAAAIRSGRPHRANGQLAYHVLDLMHTIHDASAQNVHIQMASTCDRPNPLPLGLRDGTIDA